MEKDEKATGTISYIAHEADMARMERINLRQFIINIVLILLLFGSNAAWLVYESQYDVVETEITQDVETGVGDAFVSGTGDVNYGTGETDG